HEFGMLPGRVCARRLVDVRAAAQRSTSLTERETATLGAPGRNPGVPAQRLPRARTMAAASSPHVTDEPSVRRGIGRSDARSRSRWRHLWRALSWVFLALVATLVVRHALQIDWRAVGDALRQASAGTLLLAALLAGISHLLYATFDVIGRHQTRHRLG